MCQACYGRRKRGPESLNKLLKVTHQISSGAGICTKICPVAKPIPFTPHTLQDCLEGVCGPKTVMSHSLRSFLRRELLVLIIHLGKFSYQLWSLPGHHWRSCNTIEFLLPPSCHLTSGKKRAVIWINRSGYYMPGFSFCLINCYLWSIEGLWPFQNKF